MARVIGVQEKATQADSQNGSALRNRYLSSGL